MGNELDQLAEARDSHHHQEHARHQARGQQAGQPVARDYRREHDHERRRRTRDLELGAARDRDHDTGDDRRVQAMLWRHPDRDRERHGQRQRHDPDHQPRQRIGAKIREAVALGQHLAQRRRHRQLQGHASPLGEQRKERAAFGHASRRRPSASRRNAAQRKAYCAALKTTPPSSRMVVRTFALSPSPRYASALSSS